MKKIILTMILLVIVISLGLYCVLYFSFNLSDSGNTINVRFRRYVLHHRFLKTIFRLHQVGDARYEYLKDYATPLEIHVFLQHGQTLEKGTISNVTSQLQQITYKTGNVIVHEPIFITQTKERMNNNDIDALLNQYEFTSSFLSPSVPLNIFVLREYERYPSYAGLVVDANSIILFKKIIADVSDHQSSPENVEVSTILHEFGHLAGADHISNNDCILAEKVENVDLFHRPAQFRTSYCSEDITAIMSSL